MKVIVAGDFAPRNRLAAQVESGRFSEIFSDELVNLLKSADYSLVNFESPVVEGDAKPIAKCGPNLKCTPHAIDAVRYAGFQALTLANNHIFDFGTAGLNKTLEYCKVAKLDSVGVGENLDEAGRVLYVQRNGKALAVINCCEHEFSIATNDSPGANPLNPIRQYYSILEARKNADYVLVVVHGGHEHYRLPSPRMQETYRFFIDSGADVVVNHHQHCYSGYEIYKGKPIFYGLGNFCFDILGTPSQKWTEGYMVELSFETTISFKLHPYRQYAQEPRVELIVKSAFDDELDALNAIIRDAVLLKKKTEEYYSAFESWGMGIFEPYNGRILSMLFRRGILPRIIKGRKLSLILNYIACESHRDKVLHLLTGKNK